MGYQLNYQGSSANPQDSIRSDTSQRFSVAGLAGQLFPALIDTWNEAISDTKSNKRKKDTAPSSYFLVPNESVPILISIIKTLKTIIKLVKHEERLFSASTMVLQREFGTEYVSKVMEKFPCEVSHLKNDQRKEAKEAATPQSSYSSFDLNLCIISYYIEWLALQGTSY